MMLPWSDRFRQLGFLLACGISALSLADSLTWAGPEVKPNIIFILADDLGYGDVGFNGQQHIRTPHLDAMARDGIVFSQHYAGSTVCMPSRCTLMTGKHTGHATVRGNPRWTASGRPVDLGSQDVTVAEELKRAGYRTAIIGKWGLAEADDRGMPLQQGFDAFFGYRTHGAAHHYYPATLWRDDRKITLAGNDSSGSRSAYSHDVCMNEALQFIDTNRDEPFFLYLALTIPHLELTVPEDSKVPYQNLDWPVRPMSRKGHYKNDAEGNTTYAGMISRMDRDIGRLRADLKRLAIEENTLIIFSSDNGPEFEKRDRFFNSNGPLRGGKRDLYEGGIRVPFVATWPGRIRPGTRSDHISAFWDFLPTACEIAGLEPTDSAIDGYSYLPTLQGNPSAQRQHDYLYWEFNERAGPVQAIRFKNWKAIRFKEDSDQIELYDLSNDLAEEHDLSETHTRELDQILRLFAQARDQHPEFVLSRRTR